MSSTLSPCKALETQIQKPPTTVKDTGRSTCEEIQRIRNDAEVKKAALNVISKGISSALNAINPVTGLANIISSKVGNNTQQTNEFINKVETVINNVTSTQTSNICNNLINSAQSNVISKSPKCIEESNKLPIAICGSMKDDNNKMECINKFSGLNTTENITQSNSANLKNDCQIISAISELSKNSSDSQTQALIKSIQDAKGMGNTNTSSNFSCNDVKTTINSASYLNALSCCSQQINNLQTNLIDACGKVSNVVQSNLNDQQNSCLIENGISTKIINEGATKMTLSASDKQKNNNSGSITMIVIGIIILVLCILIGGAYALYVYADNTPLGKASKFIR